MKKKKVSEQSVNPNTGETHASYVTSSFSIETPQTKPQQSGQEYSRDFLPDAGQYSTSGKVEKSLAYVIKRK
jgi:hypothetical protein